MEATLRERAEEARAQRIAANIAQVKKGEEEEMRQARECFEECFAATFGMEPDAIGFVPTEGIVVTSGDLKFLFVRHGNNGAWFFPKGTCPTCGEASFSRTAPSSLEELGDLLANFQPDDEHLCPATLKEPTGYVNMGELAHNALVYADAAKRKLADVLSALSIVEGNARQTRERKAKTVAEFEETKTVLTVAYWPGIDPTDPVTKRSNKAWAEKQLVAILSEDPQFVDGTKAVAEEEEIERLQNLELDRAKLSVKLADLEWRYAMAEVKARTALLTFSEGL